MLKIGQPASNICECRTHFVLFDQTSVIPSDGASSEKWVVNAVANLAWYIDHIPMERVSGRSDTEASLKEVGKAIRVRRLELDISQETLAHLANIDRSHMGKIERGERNVTLLNLLKIARALSCRPSELLGTAGL